MPTKLIINCETGEQTEVELTADEIAQREADAAKAEAEANRMKQQTLPQSTLHRIVSCRTTDITNPKTK